MKTNTELFNTILAADPSYHTLVDMIDDLGLEVMNIEFQA